MYMYFFFHFLVNGNAMCGREWKRSSKRSVNVRVRAYTHPRHSVYGCGCVRVTEFFVNKRDERYMYHVQRRDRIHLRESWSCHVIHIQIIRGESVDNNYPVCLYWWQLVMHQSRENGQPQKNPFEKSIKIFHHAKYISYLRRRQERGREGDRRKKKDCNSW